MARNRNQADDPPGATPGASDSGTQTLGFLHEQRLDPTPANYALGYLYVTQRNSLAARAIDLVLMAGDRLDQTRVNQIVSDHVRPAAGDASDQENAVRRQALQLSEIAADASAITGQLNRNLDTGLAALGDGAEIAAIIRSLAAQSRLSEAALAAASRQIEVLRQEVETAKGDAARDALTGLLNRRGVEAEVRGLSARMSGSLVMCDIDRFKSINDRYGHVVGDRVLKLVATSLAGSCAPHLVARWGGEEFLVLVNGASPKDAAAIVDRARLHLRGRDVHLRATDEPMGTITFSAGVAALKGGRIDDAVREADALLYQAKAAGRDRVLA